MNLKALLIVIAVLTAASVAVFIANRPSEPTSKDSRVGAQLVDPVMLGKVYRIKLSDQGKTVTLAKQADGTWQVSDYFDFPADFSKLSQFVDELQTAKIDRFVSSNPERLARFEFKDTMISLFDNAGKELWSVTLGKYAEGGGRVIRFGSEAKAYMTHLNAWLDPDAKNWADSSLVSFKADDIAQVELTFPDSAPVVARRAKKDEAFSAEKNPEGKTLKNDKVISLLNTLSSLRFSDTSALNDPNALEAHKAPRIAKLTRFDGRTITLSLGRKPELKTLKPLDASAKHAVPSAAPGKEGPAAILGNPGSETLGLNAPVNKREGPAKAIEAATETIPAGPVFVTITDSDTKAPINALMQKRAYQIQEYNFTSLPQKSDDLFQAAPHSLTPGPAPAKTK